MNTTAMRALWFALAIGLGFAAQARADPTLDRIRQRGELICGVQTGVAGFSYPDAQGRYRGFNVDICRAIAAAIFGDPDKVKYLPLSEQQRFIALQSGDADLLSNNTTWTIQRDTELGLNFGPVVFYDGEGFMVPKKLGVQNFKELNGATICVQLGTTTELHVADYFRAHNLDFKPVVIESLDELLAAYFSGRCDALAQDASQLAAHRAGRAGNPEDHVILAERISKEPLAPVVRQGDDQWHDLVDWVVFALMDAEEQGVTQRNVDDMLSSDDPGMKRMLGVSPGLGKGLGLEDKWVYYAIKAVGNYGEIFDRNLGEGSPLKLDRSLNRLWTKGGLIYGIPLS